MAVGDLRILVEPLLHDGVIPGRFEVVGEERKDVRGTGGGVFLMGDPGDPHDPPPTLNGTTITGRCSPV
jgi:hypothetical protein